MKLTANHAIEALKNLLPNVQLVENEEDSEYDKDTFLQGVDEARTPLIKQKVEVELKDTISKSVTGAAGHKLRKVLRDTFNIPMSELEGLSDEDAITKAKRHNDKSYSSDTETLRTEYDKHVLETAAKISQIEAENITKLSESRKKYIDRDILNDIEDKIKEIPFLETANRKKLSELLKNQLESEFDLDFDEDGKKMIVIDRKTKHNALNFSGTSQLSIQEKAMDFFGANGLGVIQTDMRNAKSAASEMRDGESFKTPQTTPISKAGETKQKNEKFMSALGKAQ